MGKVVKFTGSKLLGAELRRLRGGRSLKQIAELTKTPPLSERVTPVAAPTLSQIENGVSFPSLETIHSLALIYQTSVQQLLNLVIQDRLGLGCETPRSIEEAKQRYAAAFEGGGWHECLYLAGWAEDELEPPKSLDWRANRALVLQRLGMRSDAVALLQDCVNDPDSHPDRIHRYHQMLSGALAGSGLFRSAEAHARLADETVPDGWPVERQAPLIRNRAYLTILLNMERETVDERSVRQAAARLSSLRQAHADQSCSTVQSIRVHEAACLWLLGNHLVAEKELTACIAWAREAVANRVLVEALSLHGAVLASRSRVTEALRSLEEAGALAAEMDNPDWAFEAYFEAYKLCQEHSLPARARLLKRCERFQPFVTGRSPNLTRFERARELAQ